MATITKKMKARDLPAEWRKQGSFAPDDQVRVLVEPEDPELATATTLKELMNVIGGRAEKRAVKQGITEEGLEKILHEK